ncbi:hypothetical protein OOZ51_20040 [Arthrobacter sp. MI7-26]|uniref:four-carbon acid sugar kinase family protein n=1 Tax=Arthrobacter sp. MI7-26 TaxID=2993653 RepID=UPI0022489B34|nr:four-carbon acid sugar kinase family protein [Arthrobacter sp. MI7-26]MCX2750078.1 hypothetical protein [Arthrobacter sp. MI7-26]
MRYESGDSWTIVADDLTGASDAAAPFSRRANTTIIVDGVPSQSERDVLSLNTESRYLSPSAASLAVESLVGSLIKQNRKQIFKKIDSQLRGNVGHEVAGALRAFERNGLPAFAVVAPAFPGAGRTTMGGTVFIDGQDAADEIDNADILETLRVGGLRGAVIRRNEYANARALADRIRGVFVSECDAAVVDCMTDEDLMTVATAHRILGLPALLVGSGGLAAGIANSGHGASLASVSIGDWHGNALVVIGSYSDRSRQQLDDLVSSGVCHVSLNHSDLSSERISGEVLAGLSLGHVVLTPDRMAPVQKQNAREIAEALARIVSAVITSTRILILCGGETARATLDSLKVRKMHVEGELEPGVVVHSITARHLLVVTKAGAFGGRQTITNVLEQIGSHDSLTKGDKSWDDQS